LFTPIPPHENNPTVFGWELWNEVNAVRTGEQHYLPWTETMLAEHFAPAMLPHPRLRIYVLQGRQTWLLWCRNTQNTWQTELEQGRPPEELRGLMIELTGPSSASVRAYDPWADRWTDLSAGRPALELPPFSRSLVLRLPAPAREPSGQP
jgi:hypothetical protein